MVLITALRPSIKRLLNFSVEVQIVRNHVNTRARQKFASALKSLMFMVIRTQILNSFGFIVSEAKLFFRQFHIFR